MSRPTVCLLAALCLLPLPLRAAPFELSDGDRVVWIGNTLIEREQRYGYWETALTLRYPDRNIIFRNLGWSGDTVFGTARSYFGPPGEGIERLAKHLEMLRPTVLFACYGHDVALDRELKIGDFIDGYDRLLDLARSKSPELRM